jgi:hypothetical protein
MSSEDTRRAFRSLLSSSIGTGDGDTTAQDREAAQMIARMSGCTPEEAMAAIRKAERDLGGNR